MKHKKPQPKGLIVGDTPGGNYVEELMNRAGDLARPGEITRVNIFHDDWCRIYKQAPCNCNPEIRPAQ